MISVAQMHQREMQARSIMSGQPESVRRILDCVICEEFSDCQMDRAEASRERVVYERFSNDATRMVAECLGQLIRRIARGEQHDADG